MNTSQCSFVHQNVKVHHILYNRVSQQSWISGHWWYNVFKATLDSFLITGGQKCSKLTFSSVCFKCWLKIKTSLIAFSYDFVKY